MKFIWMDIAKDHVDEAVVEIDEILLKIFMFEKEFLFQKLMQMRQIIPESLLAHMVDIFYMCGTISFDHILFFGCAFLYGASWCGFDGRDIQVLAGGIRKTLIYINFSLSGQTPDLVLRQFYLSEYATFLSDRGFYEVAIDYMDPVAHASNIRRTFELYFDHVFGTLSTGLVTRLEL